MTTDFGRDTWCLDSPRTGRLVTGTTLVAQRVYRRLITPRGMLRGGEDEANFGLDLSGLIGNVSLSTGAIEGMIRGEVLKDPQVETATVTAAKSTSGAASSYSIEVSCTTALGPFDLVLEVSDVTVALVGLETS